MPKLQSAKKHLRQNVKRQARNRATKEAYKALKRQIKKVIKSKTSSQKLDELVREIYKRVDKAAKAGAIHKNKAAREKSRIMALLKKNEPEISKKNLKQPEKARKQKLGRERRK